MSKLYRNVFFVSLAIIIALLAFLYIQDSNNKEVIKKYESEKSELMIENEDLNTKVNQYELELSNNYDTDALINSLNEEIRALETVKGSPLYLNDFELQLVTSMGIADVEIISDDLRNSIEVIQTPGDLGGTMRFEDIYLLNSQYVYATISDGHYLGFGIFRYNIDSNKIISWESVYEKLF